MRIEFIWLSTRMVSNCPIHGDGTYVFQGGLHCKQAENVGTILGVLPNELKNVKGRPVLSATCLAFCSLVDSSNTRMNKLAKTTEWENRNVP
jgi:hypothetical protein